MPTDNTASHPHDETTVQAQEKHDSQNELQANTRFERQLEQDRAAALASLDETTVRLATEAPNPQVAPVKAVQAPVYVVDQQPATSSRGLRHPVLTVMAAALAGAVVGGSIVGGVFAWQGSARQSNVGILGVEQSATQESAQTGGNTAHPTTQGTPNASPTSPTATSQAVPDAPVSRDTTGSRDDQSGETSWGDVADGLLDEGVGYLENMTLGDVVDLLQNEGILEGDWLDYVEHSPYGSYSYRDVFGG